MAEKQFYKPLLFWLAMDKDWQTDLSERAERLAHFVERHEYICPMPHHWDKLFRLLPTEVGDGKGLQNPPVPLILNGWSFSGKDDKKRRFFEHLFWADKYGAIGRVERFLRKLKPEDWYKG